jgi:hypothetical protein
MCMLKIQQVGTAAGSTRMKIFCLDSYTYICLYVCT